MFDTMLFNILGKNYTALSKTLEISYLDMALYTCGTRPSTSLVAYINISRDIGRRDQNFWSRR